MKNNFLIREAELKDAEDLINTYLSYYDEFIETSHLRITLFKNKPSIKDEIAWFFNNYKRKLEEELIMLVPEVNGKAVGLCTVEKLSPGTFMEHIGRLGISIRLEYRYRGAGYALIERAIKESEGRFEQLMLTVFEDNNIAINLYKKFGFKEFGMMPKAVKVNEKYINVIYMHRLL